MTARAARNSGAELLRASRLSEGHDACASTPWMRGYTAPNGGAVGYHPNLAGMTAVADALERMIAR